MTTITHCVLVGKEPNLQSTAINHIQVKQSKSHTQRRTQSRTLKLHRRTAHSATLKQSRTLKVAHSNLQPHTSQRLAGPTGISQTTLAKLQISHSHSPPWTTILAQWPPPVYKPKRVPDAFPEILCVVVCSAPVLGKTKISRRTQIFPNACNMIRLPEFSRVAPTTLANIEILVSNQGRA